MVHSVYNVFPYPQHRLPARLGSLRVHLSLHEVFRAIHCRRDQPRQLLFPHLLQDMGCCRSSGTSPDRNRSVFRSTMDVLSLPRSGQQCQRVGIQAKLCPDLPRCFARST
jgi:hypothetical protein